MLPFLLAKIQMFVRFLLFQAQPAFFSLGRLRCVPSIRQKIDSRRPMLFRARLSVDRALQAASIPTTVVEKRSSMCYAAACTKGRSRTDHLATAHYLLGVLQPHMLSPEPAAGAARSGRYVLGGAILSP